MTLYRGCTQNYHCQWCPKTDKDRSKYWKKHNNIKKKKIPTRWRQISWLLSSVAKEIKEMNLGLLRKNPASGYAWGGGGYRISGLQFPSARSRCLLFTEGCAIQTNKILSFIAWQLRHNHSYIKINSGQSGSSTQT